MHLLPFISLQLEIPIQSKNQPQPFYLLSITVKFHKLRSLPRPLPHVVGAFNSTGQPAGERSWALPFSWGRAMRCYQHRLPLLNSVVCKVCNTLILRLKGFLNESTVWILLSCNSQGQTLFCHSYDILLCISNLSAQDFSSANFVKLCTGGN